MYSRRANYTDRHCVLRTVCSSIVSLYETRLSITRTSKRSTPTFGAAVRPERDVHTSGLRASGTRDPSASRHSAKPKSDEWCRTRKKTAISYLDCRNSHNKTPRDSEIYDSHCTVVYMSTMRCLKVANFYWFQRILFGLSEKHGYYCIIVNWVISLVVCLTLYKLIHIHSQPLQQIAILVLIYV